MRKLALYAFLALLFCTSAYALGGTSGTGTGTSLTGSSSGGGSLTPPVSISLTSANGTTFSSTLTSAANTGYAGYFTNTSTATGYGLYVNGTVGFSPPLAPASGGAGVPVTIYTLAHTTTSGENGSVQALNSSTSASFTLAQAGTTGFALNSAYSFLNIGSGALNLITTGSAFNGMPVTGSNIVLNQYGYATCAPDANGNWDCSGNQTAAPSATNLGSTITNTSPSINGDQTTGFYTAGAGKIDAAISGVKALELTATSTLNLPQTTGAYQINGNTVLSIPTGDSTPSATVNVGVGNFPTAASGTATYANVAVGYHVFGNNALTTSAVSTVGIGNNAMFSLTSGSGNTAVGNFSGYNTTSGSNNYFLGGGYGNSTGSQNTDIGSSSGNSIATGSGNTLIGYKAGYIFNGGSNNTIIGANVASTVGNSGLNNSVLIGTTTGTDAWTGTTGAVSISCGNVQSGDTCVGYQALNAYSGVGGSKNSILGYQALNASTTATGNTALGYQAGKLVTSGTQNLALGYQVGSTVLTGGSNNILIGVSSAISATTSQASNEIHIGGTGGDWVKVTGANTNTTELTTMNGALNVTATLQLNGADIIATAGTGLAKSGNTLNSNAVYQISFQPGLITSITNTKSVYAKITKASTVDNIEGSASAFSCVSNPTITFYECGTDAACATSPTTIGSVTVTAAGTAVDGTVSNAAVTANDYVAWALSAGTCTSLDIAGTAQIHSN